MKYRALPHGGKKISLIGLGAGSLSSTKDEMVEVLNAAIENGVNYFDLARVGDELAKGHYRKLPVHADACLRCGHCESRCPFHVKQEDRMREIAEYFVSYAT